MNEMQGFKRPGGNLAVRYRRTGVEPAGFDFLFPIWAITRIRWQFGPRTWSVEVNAPGRFRNALTNRVFEERVATRALAWELAQRVAERVERGEFDRHLA